MATKQIQVETETVQIDREFFDEFPEVVEFELPDGTTKTYMQVSER